MNTKNELKNIYESQELQEISTIRKSPIVRIEQKFTGS
nr:MAG TPA: hypothetical protein [Caudoviricetes sp.]